MIIHTVSSGETIFSIARKYAVSPVKIIENNCLPYPDRLTIGQQLLVLTPTRSYFVRGGDTAAKICRRFGIKKDALLAANPALHGKTNLHAGTELTLHFSTPLYGICAINGYVYEGTSTDRFQTLLPYLTYVTFCGRNENRSAMIKATRDENKIPLKRISIDELFSECLSDKQASSRMLQKAKEEGYLGISLCGGSTMDESAKNAFSLEVKKELLGMDMLLFLETEASSSASADVSDGIVLLYEKVYQNKIPSFDSGERIMIENHAKGCEAGKSFLELPSFGFDGEKPLTHEQIQKIMVKYGAELSFDDSNRISFFDYYQYKDGKKHPVRIVFESLENIKAKLELLHEFGFLGVMLDVGRVPISYIMMIYNMFAAVINPQTGIYTL